ncbi:hypothetical protein ACIRPX_43960 [Streptomyces sp. NPDC101225]|uniref:hypothetical protein n=1 Tax=Streptomyces sp. NPDC101225 TaxID=3366135 RepID=UPI003819DBE6
MLSPIKIAGCGVEVDVALPSGVSTEEIQNKRRKLADNLNRHKHEVVISKAETALCAAKGRRPPLRPARLTAQLARVQLLSNSVPSSHDHVMGGGTMHRTIPALAAALLFVGTLAGCSDSNPDAQPAKHSTTAKASAAASKPKKLADTYTDKLDAVSDGSVEDCQSPSSVACSDDLGAIMTVVDDLQKDIDANGGAATYPTSTKQIAKMRAAQKEYEDNACEGDPAADDPNSNCWGIMQITVGSKTLTMTLGTDELS